MSGQQKIVRIAGVVLVAALVVGLVPATQAARERSIEEFIAAQGQYCIDDGSGGCLLFVPPYRNFMGWFALTDMRLASIDYAGLADHFTCPDGHVTDFGTRFSGSVIERDLKDGRVEVTVNLFTKNALAWAIDGVDLGFTGPLSFGYRACDTLPAGQAHALANSSVHLEFINPGPNMPLPDLMQLYWATQPGQQPLRMTIHASAEGPLRSLESNDFIEGAAGQLTVIQTDLTGRPRSYDQCTNPNPPATCDSFPAERVIVQPAD